MQVKPHSPFEENLYLIFDTEVFNFVGLPTVESLKDDTKNTMLVDFVRTYELSDTDFDSGLLENGSFENGSENWFWQGDVSLHTLTSDLNDGVVNLNLKNGGSIIQKIVVTKNTEYTLNLNLKARSGNVKVEILDIADETFNDAAWTEKSMTFNTGDTSELYIKVTGSTGADVLLDAFIVR